ncbi:MAG: hypothetical protein ACOC80_10345 [Petrotogales bacterium]
MDKLSQAIVTLDVHFADKDDRLRNAWGVVHAELVEGQKTNHQQLKSAIVEYSNKLSDRITGLENIPIGEVVIKLRQLADI